MARLEFLPIHRLPQAESNLAMDILYMIRKREREKERKNERERVRERERSLGR